jgi:hypothetical protein
MQEPINANPSYPMTVRACALVVCLLTLAAAAAGGIYWYLERDKIVLKLNRSSDNAGMKRFDRMPTAPD